MKIVSWNVNGIRAALKKGFHEFIDREKPEIMCIQETKAHPDQVDEIMHDYEHHFWNSAEKKGYSGTAVFSKVKPISVVYGDGPMNDTEGRVITLEFENFYLVNVYTMNSGAELRRLEKRQEWDKEFLTFIKNFEKKKPVIICGDLNVAHKEIDIARPKQNERNAGFTVEERRGMEKYIENDLIDTFREFNKEPNNYSYWSYKFNARANNTGWRMDYFLISKVLRQSLKNAFILSKVMGSDHCPIGIIIKDNVTTQG